MEERERGRERKRSSYVQSCHSMTGEKGGGWEKKDLRREGEGEGCREKGEKMEGLARGEPVRKVIGYDAPILNLMPLTHK